MGNKNSRSRLTHSFETFDPVAPASTIGTWDERPSSASSRQIKVSPMPTEGELVESESVNDSGSEVDCSSSGVQSPRNRQTGESHPGSGPGEHLTSSQPFDFDLTEGQTRRTLMAECEFECSMITPHLFVSGAEIAKSWEVLRDNGISQVINCSASVVESHFENRQGMSYLSLRMVDGRQDDISWFVCEVAQTIKRSVRENKKVLLHCEKGISRSCSFAIAYQMLSQRLLWKEAFDDVKSKRTVCNPNTAFTCNLMEIGELTAGKGSRANMLLRLSSHLPHDVDTPVFKPCRDGTSRRLLHPSTTLLDPSACFIVRPGYLHDWEIDDKNVLNEDLCSSNLDDHSIYLWFGEEVAKRTVTAAQALAEHMVGIFAANDARVVMIEAGREPTSFWCFCHNDGPYVSGSWDDLYKPSVPGAQPMKSIGSLNQQNFDSSTDTKSGTGASQQPLQKSPQSATAASACLAMQTQTTASQPAVTTNSLGSAPLDALNSANTSSTERLATHRSSASRISPSDSTTSNGSASRGGGQRQSTSNLILQSPHLSPDTSTTSIGGAGVAGNGGSTPSLTRRTPSADKYPREPGLIREPTPVEDFAALAAKGSLIGSHETTQQSSGMALALLKPLLFQAVEVRDPEHCDSDYHVRVHGWQGLGVYDDDDLQDSCVLLLLCPLPGPHFLWVGQDFDVSSVVDLELEDIDEEHLPLRQWAGRVLAGEAQVFLRNGIKPDDVKVIFSGEETEEFWVSFNEGF